MNRTWLLIFVVFLFSLNCSKKTENKQMFFPGTIDGVTCFSMTDHTLENHFSGNWVAPVLTGKGGRKSRTLTKGTGTIEFTAVAKGKYILDMDFTSPDKHVEILINGNKENVAGRKKFLDREKIRVGKNRLSFIHKKGLRFNEISVYPKRVLRIREHEKLIKDKRILFLPGSLQFFVKAEEGERIQMKLGLSGIEVIEANILLQCEKEKIESRRKIKNGKSFEIKLLSEKFQEIIISFPSQKQGHLKVLESFIVKRNTINKAGRQRTAKIRDLVKNKNLLFILLDATRNDRTGYSGYNRETTPNIDTFSKESVIFTNGYTEASYTLASTGTLLTGLPPDFHGVISSFYSALNRKITTLAELFLLKGYFTGAISANPNFGKAYKYDEGFSEFNELFLQHPAVQAEEFVKPFRQMIGNAGEKPFFIYLHLREPHDPFVMPPPYFTRFQNEYPEITDKIPSIFKASKRENENSENLRSLLGKLYDGNLAYGDMVFGKLIDILNQKGIARDTMVVFLSDHGEAIGEHGVYGHGHVLFQQSIRIPFVIKIPGLEGYSDDTPAITSDLVRTLTDIFELPYPYRKNSYGRNMFNPVKKRRMVIRSVNAFNYPGYSIIQYPYKLIVHFPFNENTIELFDLEKDPGEDQAIHDRPLVRETLLFYLFNHLRSAADMKQEIVNPELRKKDIKSLESLGYL